MSHPKEEKIRLPVGDRGSKKSVLKLPNEGLGETKLTVSLWSQLNKRSAKCQHVHLPRELFSFEWKFLYPFQVICDVIARAWGKKF